MNIYKYELEITDEHRTRQCTKCGKLEKKSNEL